MVSFSCEVCNDTVVKKKLGQHQSRCHGAYFTCIDCSTTFHGNDHNQHTKCISEAEKYEKALYRGKNQKKQVKQKVPEKKPVEEKVPEKKPVKEKVPEKKSAKQGVPANKSEVSNKDLTFAPLVNNKPQNLYKILKKASKDDSKKLKKILKELSVAKIDGRLVIE